MSDKNKLNVTQHSKPEGWEDGCIMGCPGCDCGDDCRCNCPDGCEGCERECQCRDF